jgi:hypothetical protein
MNKRPPHSGSYFWYGVCHMSSLAGVVRLIVLSTGLLGANVCGFCLAVMDKSNGSRAAVLAAGPTSSTRTIPLKVGLPNRTAPPEYRSVPPVNSQSSQSKPSSACCPPLTWSRRKGGPKPGTDGSFPISTAGAFDVVASIVISTNGYLRGVGGDVGGEDGVCAKVIVWLPKNSDPSKSPTVNDPNAKVILDITPPPSGKAGNCSVLEYRYGEPPPLKTPRPKQEPIIPPGNRKAIPRQTKRDRSSPLPSRA